MDRPERLNALDLEHVVTLRDALRDVAGDDATRVVILTGAGRAFTAGGDVTAMVGGNGGGAGSEPLDLRSIMEISELLHTMPAITVAAVNGPCAGAGLSFACACDLRYAARSAVFVSAFLRVGSSGDHGSAWVVTQAVGPAKARELLLLGDRVGADEALRIGLVTAVVDDKELTPHVAGIAARLAGMPPTATRLMKANLDDAVTVPLAEYLDRETERFDECSGSAESIAAANAFLSKD